MKKFTIQLFVMLLSFSISTMVSAQIKTPAPSPKCKVEQTVGLSTITLEYSRPSKKDRTIYAVDGLVPFGQLWRTGANQATKITFSDDVTLEGKKLAAGTYAILTKPDLATWDVNFYKYEASGWNSYTEKTPDLSVAVKPVSMVETRVESFMINIGNLRDESATLYFLWDNLYVPVQIGVEADAVVMKNIDQVLAGPSSGDYYTAGSYYHTSGKDLNKALDLVQKATKVDEPKFWQVRRESLILADLGRYKEAVAAAKLSLKLATAAGNAEYVKMNTESIADWAKM